MDIIALALEEGIMVVRTVLDAFHSFVVSWVITVPPLQTPRDFQRRYTSVHAWLA